MMDALVHNAWLVPILAAPRRLDRGRGGKWLKQRSSHAPVVASGSAWRFSSRWSCWSSRSGRGRPRPRRSTGSTVSDLDGADRVPGRRPDHDDAGDGHVRGDLVVAIYASGYMAGDPGYPRFFAVVGLFVFSMTGLVLSANYLLTYAFWEGVGVCSYLLVGFWHTKPAAAAAAKKAFLVNRVGDVGFAIAIFWMWVVFAVARPELRQLPFERRRTSPLDAGRRRWSGSPLLLFWAATAKICASSALRLAPRRDGRPHAGLGPDPRGHDGHGGGLPDRPVDPADGDGPRRPGRSSA